VLHFTDSAEFGGAEQALLTLLEGLDRARWRPMLIHHGEEGLHRLTAGADALGVGRLVVPRMPEGIAGARRSIRFALLVRRLRAAVFHAHMSWPFACKWALSAAALARVPAVVGTCQLYVDVPIGPSRRTQMRALGRVVGRFIAVSEATRRRLLDAFGWPPGAVVVVRNAVPAERFAVPPDPGLRAELSGGRPDLPLVLVPARLHEQKGHDVLLAAAARLPGVRFACAGDGPLSAVLSRRAGDLGVGERVRFLGHRDDLPALLAACDLVVLPSRYEGLPICLIEAMAAGRGVVATDIEGTREIVRDGETGILVPVDDATALAGAIEAASRPGEAARLGAAGRARVGEEFSASHMVRAIVAEYDRLLARRG
jgi:glycosyltransferase involved in cell wall biosynthesis